MTCSINSIHSPFRNTVIRNGLLIALVVAPLVASAAPPQGIDVRELNLDANGNIRVHEQGVVPVTDNNAALSVDDNDTSLSVDDADGSLSVDDADGSLSVDDNNGTLSVDDGGGSLTIDGTVSVAEPVTVDGTVNVAQPVTVEGMVSLADGGFATTNDAPVISTASLWGASAPGALFGIDRVTVISMYTTNHPAAVRFYSGDNVVAVFFAQPGVPLNATLTHPLEADSYELNCLSVDLCEGGFSAAGYLSIP